LNAEQLCLSAALFGVKLPLEPWHFTDAANRRIYVAALKAGGLAETLEELERSGQRQRDDASYLGELSFAYPEASELELAAAVDAVLCTAKRFALQTALIRVAEQLGRGALEAHDAWRQVRSECEAIGTSHKLDAVALAGPPPRPAELPIGQARRAQSQAGAGSGRPRIDTADRDEPSRVVDRGGTPSRGSGRRTG
jgi:hypothetical protein